MKDLSVIIPFYNEQGNLTRLHTELVQVLQPLKLTYEIIYIDDGSTDSSVNTLTAFIGKKHKAIHTHVIELRRNFGQTAAIAAGINASCGKLIVFLDADLQNDPKDIPKFINKINEGYDVVFGWRQYRKDNAPRVLASSIANTMIRFLLRVPLHDVGCSLKIYRREVLSGLSLYGETHRIMTVMTYWKGVSYTEMPVSHRQRFVGKSKYGFSRIIKLFLDLLTVKFLNSYSTKPAYIFGTIGVLSTVLSMLSLLFVAYHKLFLGIYVHRDPLFLIAIFFMLIGIQLILMGLLAELQIRTYFESQHKQIYEIKKISRL